MIHRTYIWAYQPASDEPLWFWQAECGDEKCEWETVFPASYFSDAFERAHVHTYRMNRGAQSIESNVQTS